MFMSLRQNNNNNIRRKNMFQKRINHKKKNLKRKIVKHLKLNNNNSISFIINIRKERS